VTVRGENLLSKLLLRGRQFAMPDLKRTGEAVHRGVPVSAGICRGRVIILHKPQLGEIPHREISEGEVQRELERFEQALVETRRQIQEVQRKVSESIGAQDAAIFDAHLLVLEDSTLIDEVTKAVRRRHVNIEEAFREVTEKYLRALAAIEDDYLRERAADMRDVTGRVMNVLLGQREAIDLASLAEPCVIVSHDLTPSLTAQIDKRKVLGFATDVGSKTSHTAILARSLHIPAVVALRDLSTHVCNGTQILIDGYNGVVITNPTDQTLFEYGQLAKKQLNLEDKLKTIRDDFAVTLDGVRVTLSANVESADDHVAVRENGAEGVGLFRTEFLFLNRKNFPTEEEQYLAYRRVASELRPHPVIIRTLDIGGDKFVEHFGMEQELNPFLGWRAIRFCLTEKAIFKSQLRAILRASAEGNVKLMYPMISSLDELDQANALLDECRGELEAAGVAFDRQMEVGVMIEIPSAVMVADSLARRVKFFSIGTNDLIQYTLAVDRMNEKIAHLYEPTHPAILKLIKMTVDAAHRHGAWVGVCGEMAGEPALVPLLLGLGVDELSAAPGQVPQIKFLIRRLKMADAAQLAEFALGCESGAEILERTTALARRAAPVLMGERA
jgi:phosphotransferase system enzyme I (PtsI)